MIALSASLAKICTDTSCLPPKIAQRKRSSGSDILAAQRFSPSLYLRAYTVVERRQTMSEAKNQGILQCLLRGSGPSLRRKVNRQVPPSTPANDKSFWLTANHSRCIFSTSIRSLLRQNQLFWVCCLSSSLSKSRRFSHCNGLEERSDMV